MTTAFILSYFGVGSVVGFRASVVAAWRCSPDKLKGKMRWWYAPDPLLTLLGNIFVWPIWLSANKIHKFAKAIGLLSPPKDIKDKINQAKLKELERELRRQEF